MLRCFSLVLSLTLSLSHSHLLSLSLSLQTTAVPTDRHLSFNGAVIARCTTIASRCFLVTDRCVKGDNVHVLVSLSLVRVRLFTLRVALTSELLLRVSRCEWRSLECDHHVARQGNRVPHVHDVQRRASPLDPIANTCWSRVEKQATLMACLFAPISVVFSHTTVGFIANWVVVAQRESCRMTVQPSSFPVCAILLLTIVLVVFCSIDRSVVLWHCPVPPSV